MLAAILLALGARAPAIAETGLDGHRGSPTAPRGSLAAGAIQLVSTSDQQGYHIEFYRNTAYPCAISGYQTFAISHRIGQSEAASAPLWVYMHGGGGGWFDSAGAPQPDAQYKTEESLATLLSSPAGNVLMPGLMPLVFADPAAFRVLAVSMCDHDFYGGSGAIDPNNPNRQPNGDAITTNGLLATEDAIQFIRAAFATSKYFLFGGSAGSIGTYGLAWSLQFKGIAPAGIVADSSILNQEWAQAMVAQDVPCPVIASMLGHVTEIQARLDPQIADIANEPDRLVSSGRLTVPIMQIWSHGDPYGCQAAPVACPLRDGSTAALGAMDCMNEPLRIVIAAQGPSSRSKSLGLCVTVAGYAPGLCNYHMVTRIAGTNTDPSSPADYNATVMAWIRQRLADAAPNAVGGIAEAPDVAQLGANVYASGSEPLVAIFATSAGVLVLAVGGLCYARRRR
jgi:hypothetical protein